MNLGPHAVFILASYGVCFSVVAALIVWVVVDYRMQRQALHDLEARGVRRRSDPRRGGAQ